MAMKKKAYLVILALYFWAGSHVIAQQEPIYSMYYFNPVVVNPAYAGSLDYMQTVASFRRQWTNFPGSPSTAVFSANAPFKKNPASGWGLNFLNDRIGNIRVNGLSGIYTYKINFDKSKLAFGLQSAINNFGVDFSESRLSSSNTFDEAFSQNISSWHLNFGAGVFWYSDRWYAGLGIPHLRAHRIGSKDQSEGSEAKQRAIYMLSGGYVVELNEEWRIKPSLLFRIPSGAPMQADIYTNGYFRDIFSFGIGYRTRSGIQLVGETKIIKNLRLGYAFDQALSRLGGQAGGTHEIILRYDIPLESSTEINHRIF
jgi:type IX secretion system PorP/SprF family membrane protein